MKLSSNKKNKLCKSLLKSQKKQVIKIKNYSAIQYSFFFFGRSKSSLILSTQKYFQSAGLIVDEYMPYTKIASGIISGAGGSGGTGGGGTGGLISQTTTPLK